MKCARTHTQHPPQREHSILLLCLETGFCTAGQAVLQHQQTSLGGGIAGMTTMLLALTAF